MTRPRSSAATLAMLAAALGTAPLATAPLASAAQAVESGPALAAAEASVVDARGDADRGVDLTTITYANSATSVDISIGVRGLQVGRTQTVGVWISPRQTDSDAGLHSTRSAQGKVTNRFTRSSIAGPQPTRCAGLTTTWQNGRNRVLVRIPQTCLPPSPALTFSTFMGFGNGSAGDPADVTKTVTVALP